MISSVAESVSRFTIRLETFTKGLNVKISCRYKTTGFFQKGDGSGEKCRLQPKKLGSGSATIFGHSILHLI